MSHCCEEEPERTDWTPEREREAVASHWRTDWMLSPASSSEASSASALRQEETSGAPCPRS